MKVASVARALEAAGLVAEVARRVWPGAPARDLEPAPPEPAVLGQLESRLAGVVVAALKEAFDRDRARLDLEREQIEIERRRAERLLRLEQRRQAADRLLSHMRAAAAACIVIWLTTIAALLLLPGLRDPVPRGLLGIAWGCLAVALAAAAAAHRHVSSRAADPVFEDDPLAIPTTGSLATWLPLAAFIAASAALLVAV